MELFSIGILLVFVLYGLFSHHSKVATAGLLVLLYLLFAFEKSMGDYEGYLIMYDEIKSGFGRSNDYEILYVWSCATAAKFGLTFDQMRYVFCLVEVGLIYSVIRKYTKNTALVLSLFIIFPALFEAELFRFLFGMTLVIYAIPFLFSFSVRGYISYFVFVALAALFHTSCWIFLIYYLLAVKSRKKLIFIVASFVIVGSLTLGVGSVFGVLEKLPIREHVIDKYETGEYSNINGIIFSTSKLVLIFMLGVIATWGTLIYKKAELVNLPKVYRNSVLLNSRILELNIISLLLIIPLYLSPNTQRLYHIIVFFNYIAIANAYLYKKKSIKTISGFLVSLILLLYMLFLEGTGTVYAFVSHFTEGFLVNFAETFL